MTTYYEYLQIQPVATEQEIQIAFDEKYNQCRRLVTHHDPNIVNQANLALQSLEKIREVLLDPERRAVYDEALGIGGNVLGGLADPNSSQVGIPVQTPPMVRNIPNLGTTSQLAPNTLEGWTCGKCNSISQVGSLFCKSCGSEIGQSCPKCGTLFEKTAKFCPSCGINPQGYAEEQEKLRLEAMERQRQGIRNKLSDAKSQLSLGMYGLAKDALTGFEGLGNPKSSTIVICKKDEPEWKQADALNQSANALRKNMIRQNVLKITIGYAGLGGLIGFLSGLATLIQHISNVIKYQYSFEWSYLFGPTLSMFGLALGGAIAGAVGSAIYFYQWGGRRSISQDLLFGAAAPIGLMFMLALGPICFGAVIFLVALWFGLAVLGLGTNRRS